MKALIVLGVAAAVIVAIGIVMLIVIVAAVAIEHASEFMNE